METSEALIESLSSKKKTKPKKVDKSELLNLIQLLKHSDEAENNNHSDSILIVAESLPFILDMVELDLSGLQLNDASFMILVNELLKSPNDIIQTLILDNNDMNDIGAERLSELLKRPNSSLRTLLINNNSIGDLGLISIATALAKNKRLEILSLDFNRVTTRGAKALADAIRSPHSELLSISLMGNQIGALGLKALSLGVSANTMLLELVTDLNNFDEKILDQELNRIASSVLRNQSNLKNTLIDLCRELEALVVLSPVTILEKSIAEYQQECNRLHDEIEDRLRKLEAVESIRLADAYSQKNKAILLEYTKKLLVLKTTFEHTVGLLKSSSSQIFTSNKPETIPALSSFVEKNLFIVQVSFEIKYDDLIFEKELGHGNFGVIYKGVFLDNVVAIKKLLCADDLYVDLFKKEFNLMAKLRSPNIVGLYGLSQHNGNLMIVMEYIGGCSLYAFIFRTEPSKQPQPLSLIYIHQFALQIIRGLYYLHTHDIIHRDLKTQNVMLTTEDPKAAVLKLIDFGLSGEVQTSEERVRGTPYMMAPEILKKGNVVFTKAVDIYAYGMLFFELITRKKWYSEIKTLRELVSYVVENQKRPTIPEDMTVPSTYNKILTFCWKQDPLERYTAKQVLEELKDSETLKQVGRELID